MFGWLITLLGWIGLVVLTLSFGSYALLHMINAYYFKTQNLQKRYNAEWALVTGASTGIGKSIAEKLAKQKLNVVLVALDEPHLENTFRELKKNYPQQQFIKVGCNLGRDGYLEQIKAATANINVQVVFCNAGYMLTGFLHTRSLEELMANLSCNATSAVQITHYFLQIMIEKKLRGCFVYTSSASAVMPSPFSVQYAATKAFISMFAVSLAAEVKCNGIDILAVHPSPVASNFYDKAPAIGAIEFFKNFAVGPQQLPDTIFASVGRTLWRDIGPTAVMFRLLSKVIDLNFMFTLLTPFFHMMKDFKQAQQVAEQAKKGK